MIQTKIRDLINKEIEAIRNIPIDGIIQEAVDLIYEQVHQKNGKVVISGMGKAGQIGHNNSIFKVYCVSSHTKIMLWPQLQLWLVQPTLQKRQHHEWRFLTTFYG